MTKTEKQAGSERKPQRAWITSPCPLRLPGNDGNVLPSPRRSHLSSLSLACPATLRPTAPEIPGCCARPYQIQQNGFYPPKIKYKSSLVLSQLGMSIYLNELTVLPAACQIFLQQQAHPDTLSASHLFLSPGVSQLRSSSSCLIQGGLDPFAVSVLCSVERDGARNGIGTLYTGHQFCSQPAVLAKGCVCVFVFLKLYFVLFWVFLHFCSLIFDSFLLRPS